MKINIEHNLDLNIDLGCGMYKKEGYIGIDILDFGQEIVCDVSNGIPLPDNSVSEVFSSHFFEHITEPVINKVVWEFKRVCKNGASLYIVCPPSNSLAAYDIAHYSLWCEERYRGLFNSTRDEIIEIGRNERGVFAKIKIVK
jgi:predicted SAM-dependent methyltransferase